MKKTSLHTALILPLILIYQYNSYAQTTIVKNSEDLQNEVNSAAPGATVLVSSGTYTNFEASFTATGTPENPITIKAETIGGVTLTGDSHFAFKKAAHIIFEGFIFDCVGESTLVKLEGSNNIRITRNVFELETTEAIKWVYIGGIYNDYTFQYTSHNNRVDHNIFQNKTTPGHYITIDGTSNEDQSDSRQSQYDRIDHNHFRNNSPRATNEQESIRVGWSQMSLSSGFTTIEHNLFEDCDGDPEIVSIKSCDNIVRHNTFRKSYGTLSLRHGNRNTVAGNYFFGEGKAVGTSSTGAPLHTGGIRIYGKDHLIINNYMEGLTGTIWDAPIALTQGDAIDGSSSNLTKHFRAENITIAYNTLVNNAHGIEIGYDKPGNNAYNTKLKNITIANNLITGSENALVAYIDGNDQDGEVTWTNNLMNPTGTAVLVSGRSDFSTNEVTRTNPNLEREGELWKTTSNTPTFDNGTSSLIVTSDIEGQDRPNNSNPGSDHYSTAIARFAPLTADAVGPYATGDDVLSSGFLFTENTSTFAPSEGTQTVAITTDLPWRVSKDSDWINVSPAAGIGNGFLTISVTENMSLNYRSGIVTVSVDDQSKDINIFQKGIDAPIVSQELRIVSSQASTQQEGNEKENSYDNNFDTRWSAEGIGQTITYNLGAIFDVSLLKIAVHKGIDRFSYFDVATAMDGINFTTVLENQSNSGATNELENYAITSTAQYIRIIGHGNSIPNNDWNSITDVDIYGTSTYLGINDDFLMENNITIHPVPASETLTISGEITNQFDTAVLYTLDGRQVLRHSLDATNNILDIKSLQNGSYLLHLVGKRTLTKKLTILKQ